MSDDLEQILTKWLGAAAAATSTAELAAVQVGALGKSGEITGLVKQLGQIAPERRKEEGQRRNQLKDAVAAAIEARRAELDAWVDDALRAAAGGVELPLVTLLPGDRVVGSTRFLALRPEHGSVEIGWTFLARSHWGGETNAELKRLMLDHALASVARVYFMVGEDNIRSRRAMEKIGGRLDGWSEERAMAGGSVRHVRYVIERAI